MRERYGDVARPRSRSPLSSPIRAREPRSESRPSPIPPAGDPSRPSNRVALDNKPIAPASRRDRAALTLVWPFPAADFYFGNSVGGAGAASEQWGRLRQHPPIARFRHFIDGSLALASLNLA
jgi:hypothetical protein